MSISLFLEMRYQKIEITENEKVSSVSNDRCSFLSNDYYKVECV